MIFGTVIIIFICFILLAEITDGFFVDSLNNLANKLHLSQDVAGATLLAIGSSAPELFISLITVLRPDGVAELGAGTIVGSAIFNILMITGISVMFRSGKVHWQPLIRDLLFYGNAVLILFLVFQDGKVELVEAMILIAPYILYIFILSQWKKIKFETISSSPKAERLSFFSKSKTSIKIFGKFWNIFMFPFRFVVGILYPNFIKRSYVATFGVSIAYIGGVSFILVEEAVKLSEGFGIPHAVIGLTVIAIGTSIPDLFGSIAVARQGKVDMAVSNAIGSNIFDVLIGLGLPWTLALVIHGKQINVGLENLNSSVVLLLATIVVIFFIFIFQKWNLKRWSGLLLVFFYLIYFFSIIFG